MTNVLILDDDPVVLNILSRQFQALGAEVVACREIEAAETVLDTLPIDRVLTDLCVSALGGLEGTRLLRHAITQCPEARIFAMSAHLDERARTVLEALGVVDAFEKPFDVRGVALRVLGDPGRAPGKIEAIEPLATFLSSGRIHAKLQPVVALRHASAPFPIHGMEAFASAPDDSPLRNPALLFGLAERKDRLAQTDLACARASLTELARLGRRPRLFLNAHPGSLCQAEFAKGLMEELAIAGVAPGDVVLELSERQAALKLSTLEATLAPLRKAGFRIGLDNYGEGMSNLRLLLALRPDYVKLSGALTRGIDTDPLQREVVRSTQELLTRMGIRSILGRIETPSELAVAQELGFEYGQGWHFARPMRAEELLRAGAFSGPGQQGAERSTSSPFAVPA